MGGLLMPVAVVGDGTGGLLVGERAGMVWRVEGQERRPFLDLTDRVSTDGAELSLLGLAVHPDDRSRIFVSYSNLDGDTVLSEFVRERVNSERILIQIPQDHDGHKGGWLVFGPDGLLWMSVGDDGRRNAQGEYDPPPQDALRGVIIRIDPDDPNPEPEIVARGLRNPWRVAFDIAGNLWIADVGRQDFEEVNLLIAVGGRRRLRVANDRGVYLS